MGRLRTLAILTTLGAGGASSLGSGPDAAPTTPPPSPATAPALPRKEPPAPPRQYLETGCRLFNAKRFDLAKKYLDAAQMYRDRLEQQEQVVLDVYREEYAKYAFEKAHPPAAEPLAEPSPPAVVADASRDMSVRAASSVGPASGAATSFPGSSPESLAVGSSGRAKVSAADGTISPPSQASPPRQVTSNSTSALRGTFDNKQRGRWLLQQAREQLLREQFDEAEKYIAEARTLDVRWGWFDESPDHVAQAIAKARDKAAKGGSPRDRRSALAKLREARAALAANDVEKAEQLVQEISSWGLRYGRSDDTPEKVAIAVAEARQRESIQNTEKLFKTYVDSSVRRSGVLPGGPPAAPTNSASGSPR